MSAIKPQAIADRIVIDLQNIASTLLVACMFIAHGVLPQPVFGAPAPAPRTVPNFLSDGGYIASSPARFRGDYIPITLGILGSIGALSLLDSTVRDRLAPFSDSNAAKSLRSFGDVGQVAGPIVGTAFALHGWLGDDDKSKETAFLAYETFIWAGASEVILKPIIGRARPSATDNPYDFKFGRSGSSFPSGHTTTAFAAATVFAEQYPHWYVIIPSYAGAGVVGYSRLAANQHWLSDVAAGAVLGALVSHSLRARRRRRKNYAWEFQTNGSDIELARRF